MKKKLFITAAIILFTAIANIGMSADNDSFPPDESSEEWIKKLRNSPRYANIRSNCDAIFGKQYPADMFRIAGSGVNIAFIIPSMDLIALRTGRGNNARWEEVESTFLEKLFEAIEED